MKIALLVRLFPPFFGGTELATQNIAKKLVTKGHDVHVVTAFIEEKPGLPGYSKENEFILYRINLYKIRFIGMLLYWLKIILILKKIKPDIVHCQSMMMGIAGFFAKILLRTPYVVYERGDEVYSSWYFKKQISKIVYNRADRVIALNNDMKRIIKKTCNNDILIIPNGIDLENYTNISKEKMRKKFGIKSDEKILIFVGRFDPVKGVRYLIEAMKFIAQKQVNTKLILIGIGNEIQEMQNLVKKYNLEEDVIFLGEIPNKDVPNYLIASDIFILPSLMEGFPNTVLEAMAAGLPIVATNVGGLSEIITNGENGFLVNSKNSNEIAEKVIFLLCNDEISKNISEKNRKLVENYSWENVIQKLEEIYSSSINKNNPRENNK